MKPTLFIICGYVGAGKTTTAHILSKLVNAQVASVDSTIKRVFDNPSFVGKDTPPNDFELATCYNVFALITEYMLSSGKSIIIDGAFAKNKQRILVSSIAKKLKLPYYVLYITCPDDILKNGKGVGWKAHNKIKKIYEPLNIEHHIIDTSKNVKAQLKSFLIKNKI
jgi:predicted kinase